MLQLYHIYDFIVVPHIQRKTNDPKSLQFMCSVNIAKCRRVPPHAIPPSLFVRILECAIINAFALYIEGIEYGQFDGIGHLLTYWPTEALILRDVFPIKLPSWIFHSHVTFKDRVATFFNFACELRKALFLPFVTDRRHFHHLKLLDVSGIGCLEQAFLSPPNLVKTIEKYSSSQANDARIVVLDVNILEDSADFHRIQNLNQSPDSRLKIYFHGVHFESSSRSFISKAISSLKKLGNAKIHFLHFYLCEVTENMISEGNSDLFPSLRGFQVRYPVHCSDAIRELQLLGSFVSLKQLSVAGINLHGKLKALECMSSDLDYLSLVGCGIKASDLLCLRKHLPSLMQLDLSENSFGQMEVMALVQLSKELQKIVILDLQNCKLENLDSSLLRTLMEAFLCNFPSLSILLLLYNDFSLRSLRDDLRLLAKKGSLLQLYLTVPSEAYLSDDYSMIEQRIQDLRVLFQDAIAKEKSSLYVIWEEHLEFSSWFYCR